MSIDTLKADLERNREMLDAQTFASADEIKKYFKTTLFPLLDAVVDEVEELDGDVSDLVEQAEDILQPETAGIFATIITQSRVITTELGKRLKKDDPNDRKWMQRLKQFMTICKTGEDTLIEITVSPEEQEEPPEGESELDEEDDEAEDAAPAANGNEGAGDANG